MDGLAAVGAVKHQPTKFQISPHVQELEVQHLRLEPDGVRVGGRRQTALALSCADDP
jgi:hypothetical protein